MYYRDKYIKYKTKYIELKNNQIVSGEKSAKIRLFRYIAKIRQ